MSINRVCISGNLARDAEQHGGMCALTVAVNRRERGADGEWTDVASFIDCKILGQRAAKLAGYLTKGTKVAIEGSLRQERWETSDGQKRSALRVIVDEIEFMSARGEVRREQTPTDDIPF